MKNHNKRYINANVRIIKIDSFEKIIYYEAYKFINVTGYDRSHHSSYYNRLFTIKRKNLV